MKPSKPYPLGLSTEGRQVDDEGPKRPRVVGRGPGFLRFDVGRQGPGFIRLPRRARGPGFIRRSLEGKKPAPVAPEVSRQADTPSKLPLAS